MSRTSSSENLAIPFKPHCTYVLEGIFARQCRKKKKPRREIKTRKLVSQSDFSINQAARIQSNASIFSRIFNSLVTVHLLATTQFHIAEREKNFESPFSRTRRAGGGRTEEIHRLRVSTIRVIFHRIHFHISQNRFIFRIYYSRIPHCQSIRSSVISYNPACSDFTKRVRSFVRVKKITDNYPSAGRFIGITKYPVS